MKRSRIAHQTACDLVRDLERARRDSNTIREVLASDIIQAGRGGANALMVAHQLMLGLARLIALSGRQTPEQLADAVHRTATHQLARREPRHRNDPDWA